MILIDTSVWIAVFRDRSGATARRLGALAGDAPVATCAIVQCELLQGALDLADWDRMARALAVQEQIAIPDRAWIDASRIYFELRRSGQTVRSTIDCCIAQLALDSDAELFHCDRDFETIATIRPLKQRRLDLKAAK